jgi:flagellar hook-associated protein 2
VIEITATTATAARVRSVERADVALAELQALVAGMNAARTAINEATRRGINGAEAGPLAGDPVAERIGRMLQSITTAPLTGFAERDVYLSEIGVMTRRDGTLEVNEAVFGASLARDPALYRAVFQSLSQADVAGVTVSGATSSTPSGAFDFVYTDATTATLDGDALIPRTMPAGDTAQEFYAVTGRFAGVRLRLEAGAEADATILIGTSLLDRTVATLSGLLSTAGDIAAREDSLQTTARDLEDRLTRLDDKAALAEARYRERFTAMEGLVTQIKSSGEYMTALMDAWNKQD